MKKLLIYLFLCFSFFLVGCNNNKEISGYILSSNKEIICINDKNEIESTIKVDFCYDIEKVENKIYVPITNMNSDKNEIMVLQNGEKNKVINTEQSLPSVVKYNSFDSKAYVLHTTRVLENNPNGITVINTTNDTEEAFIMLNRDIMDICFMEGKAFISTVEIDGNREAKLCLLDLEKQELIKEIVLDKAMTSMIYVPETKLIYATSELETNKVIHVFDEELNEVNTIETNLNDPYKIYFDEYMGDNSLIVNHLNYDTLKGEGITIIDPRTCKIIGEIAEAKFSHGLDSRGAFIYSCDWVDDQVEIFMNGSFVEKISIDNPTRVILMN